jgi:hypothetical protein
MPHHRCHVLSCTAPSEPRYGIRGKIYVTRALFSLHLQELLLATLSSFRIASLPVLTSTHGLQPPQHPGLGLGLVSRTFLSTMSPALEDGMLCPDTGVTLCPFPIDNDGRSAISFVHLR